MCKPTFDYTRGEYIYHTSDNTGMDSEGHMHIRISKNMTMDTDSGELHLVSNWDREEEDD